MRVLMVNRPDSEALPGGDTVQMRQTARALRDIGVEVEDRIGPLEESAYRAFDIAHVFNLQTPVFTHGEVSKAAAAGCAVAVSTIFWDFGAERLLSESPKWQRLERVVGRWLTLRLARRRVALGAVRDRLLIREVLERADVCLPNSQAEIGHLRRITRELGPVRVVPNAIDAARFDPGRSHGLPEWASSRGIPSRGYLLVAARIDPDKNQLPFCRALEGSGIPIVLAGLAPDAALREACERTGAICAGQLEGDELLAAYAHAKVHALPSLRETPGLASLEAAAMGSAIVSTNVGSAREYFGDDAFYCDPLSANSMRSAALSAWKSGAPADLSELIRTEYDWSRAAKETLAAYGYALGERGD